MPLDLEDHRKEAKRLVRAYRSGDPQAVARAEVVLGGRAGDRFGLSNAQHVVAREQGHRSWPELKHSAEATSERVVETGRRYRKGEPVRVLVRKRHHRYLVSDDGQAVRLAGRPQGRLELAERVVREDYLNVNRRGVVFVGTVYPRMIDGLVVRVGDRSLAVYEALLELDGG